MSADSAGGFGRPVTDRGKRLSEAVLIARAVGGEGKWIAARLSDGGTDGNVYDTRADAIRHQIHETQCAYLPVPPTDMPPPEATAWLELNEKIYASGMRLTDPEAGALGTIQQIPYLNRAARRRALRERQP